MEKQQEISYGTRYPQEVLQEMRKLAQQHGRSLNREIVWALREYIARERGQSHHASSTVNRTDSQANEQEQHYERGA
jgi:hypothetical protein